jgi:hypothetical protein
MSPYLEKTHHKNKAGGVAQGEGPEFKTKASRRVPSSGKCLVLTMISIGLTSKPVSKQCK